MQYVPCRTLQNESSVLRKKLESEGELIVTVGGELFALMINLNESEDIPLYDLPVHDVEQQIFDFGVVQG
jgi:hypothetical protein